MKKNFNIHEAKTNFSKLIEVAEAGGEIIIARAGKPVAKLIKYDAEEFIKLNYDAAKGLIPEWTDEEWERADEIIRASFAKEKEWHKEL